ncbi:MAG: endonuclease domain-containing protein [Proteobacteria bacterium]|nr:endonuclease domain-containing protein [Pseudomonadota bacterium]
MSAFQRDAVQVFRFVRCSFDAATGVARLVYAFDDGAELVETISIPGAPFVLDAARAAAIERALRLLHLIAGVSYYKAAVPREIRIDGYTIDADTADLLGSIYENGLGEFAYRNGIDLRGRIRFPSHDVDKDCHPWRDDVESGPSRPAIPGRAFGTAADADRASAERGAEALTAIGGGKDSLVAIEALRAVGVEQTVAWIGSSPLIAACAARTGLPTLNIGRQIAPALFEFNRQGAYNGHIPVTAINSAILVLAAVLHGSDQVVFANERSASYGSQILDADGKVLAQVNHQWSKGWAFERDFGAYVHAHIAADLHYYSLLRPLSELAVARLFARSDRYDTHFSSCNRNFHILGERPANRWCGQCPKCHFVFLALAPFMPKPRLMGIFGRNLLDEPALAAGFDALIEYRDHKPFECVGEGREARAAFAALAQRPAWREDALIKRFAREIAPQLGAIPSLDALLSPHAEHHIPAALWDRLHAHFGA